MPTKTQGLGTKPTRLTVCAWSYSRAQEDTVKLRLAVCHPETWNLLCHNSVVHLSQGWIRLSFAAPSSGG